MGRIFFEDLVAGETKSYGGYAVSESEIDAFGRDFDPDSATLAAPEDGPVASPWLVAGINMRMVYEDFIAGMASMGGPGLDSIAWPRRVRAGDRLSGSLTIVETRPSKSRPEMGLVRLTDEVRNQAGAVVMAQSHLVMVRRRGTEEQPRAVAARPQQADAASAVPEGDPGAATPPAFEALEIGARCELGAVHFDRASILRFATAYDPQPFHVDEEAARRSHFGGLAASGWQTAAGASQAARAHHRRTYGGAPTRRGPMLGLTALTWRQPVYAGDTVRYAMRIEAKRPADMPGWGLVDTYTTGVNQAGALVFDFHGTSLWRMAP